MIPNLSREVRHITHDYIHVVNRFILAALIQADATLDVLRREIRRLSPGIKVDKEELAVLLQDVLKRDVLEGDMAAEAKTRVSKASSKTLRKRTKKTGQKNKSTHFPGDFGVPAGGGMVGQVDVGFVGTAQNVGTTELKDLHSFGKYLTFQSRDSDLRCFFADFLIIDPDRR